MTVCSNIKDTFPKLTQHQLAAASLWGKKETMKSRQPGSGETTLWPMWPLPGQGQPRVVQTPELNTAVSQGGVGAAKHHFDLVQGALIF